MSVSKRLPTFFISHGGGPWPWMEGMAEGPYAALAASLRRLAADAGGRPRAVLVISAHWEAEPVAIQSSPAPGMLYDYYGFPEHTYRVRYPAPGDPTLAERVRALLDAAGIPAVLDPQRGFDHGMFAPMAVAYPTASMPILQLSLRAGLDPLAHVAIGRALAPLRDQDVLIIGSGLSFHNLRRFGPAGRDDSAAFDGWLQATLALPPAQRTRGLCAWNEAPSARLAHPREEHLLPLMVAVGAAEDEAAAVAYHEGAFMGGITVSSFRFGSAAA